VKTTPDKIQKYPTAKPIIKNLENFFCDFLDRKKILDGSLFVFFVAFLKISF
jgi:hypothetical protein